MSDSEPRAGLRERKRRETLQRIVEVSLRLFAAQGYETTTLDAIATAAGISRRTFFHYFQSKDDILLSLQGGLGDGIIAQLAARQPGEAPLVAMRAALRRLAAPYSPQELLELDRLMRSSEAVQARKQASYLRDEGRILATLTQLWPDEPAAHLRVVALLAVNLSRLALDTWSAEGGSRTLLAVLDETLAALDEVTAERWEMVKAAQ